MKTSMTILVMCASLITAMAGPSTARSEPVELVLSAYGGAYSTAIKKHIGAFEKENNVKITFIPASGAAAIAKAKAREADVIHADLEWSLRGEMEGLFEKLDPSIITNLSKLYPNARLSDYSIVANFGDYGIAYNPKLVNPAPTSWLNLWDPKYKDKISTRAFDAANIELLVLLAKMNGGNEDNIGPGFVKMAELGKNVRVFYDQHPQLLDLFRNEEVVMARWTRGRVTWANGQGLHLAFAVPREGAIALVSTLNVVKGRPHTELAMKLVNHLLGAEAQTALATDLGYTPTRADLKLDAKALNIMYGSEDVDKLIMANWRKIIPHLDAWKERWEIEVVGAR